MKDGREESPTAVAMRWGRVLTRPALLALGWIAIALALVGLVVPVFPTVPFLLVALWAFARSSQRFHDWIYDHPRLGPPLRDWRDYRAISLPAKIFAVAGMATSFGIVTFAVAEDWIVPTLMAACLIPVAIYIVTRPGRPAG